MKKFGILVKGFIFDNIIFLFILSKQIMFINFIISIFYLLKKNKKLFVKKILNAYKFFSLLILILFVLGLINNISLINHFKFLSILLLILISLSISLYFFYNPKNFLNCLKFLNIINFLVIIDVFVFQLFNFSILTNWYNYIPTAGLRYSSIFYDEKILGFYLLSSLPLILLYKKNYNPSLISNNFFFLILLVFYVTAIYLTGERRSFILSIITVILIFYNHELVKKIYKKSLLVISILIFLFLAILSSKERIMNNINPEIIKKYNASLNYRMLNLTIDTIKSIPIFFNDKEEYKNYINKNGIGNWLLLYDSSLQLYSKEIKNIFFGIGFKNYKSKCIENKNLICSTHPHHYLIEFLLSFGLVGLSLFIFYFYKIIFYLLINRTHNREYLIFIFIFFFPFLPSGSIFSINVLSTLSVFSSLFLAHQYISIRNYE